MVYAEGADSVSNGLLQYGAVGILALVALCAVWQLWRRQERTYDAERQRGDRLEAELLALNKLINNELSGHLVRATEAMKDVTDVMKYQNRDRP